MNKEQYNKIIMPFLGQDKNSIKEAIEFAKSKYHNAKKYIYKKPEFIKFNGKLKDESFWTNSSIEINN